MGTKRPSLGTNRLGTKDPCMGTKRPDTEFTVPYKSRPVVFLADPQPFQRFFQTNCSNNVTFIQVSQLTCSSFHEYTELALRLTE